MVLACVATGLVFIAPLVLIGAPDYPAGDWRRAVLWTLVAGVLGPVVREVVHRLKVRERSQHIVAAHLDGVLTAATEHSIIATDTEGIITTFNLGAEKMLGYEAGEVVGRITPAAIHDTDEVVQRAAELGIAPGFDVFVHAAKLGGSETREWTYLTKTGGRIPVRLTVTAMRDDAGQTFGFIGVATDITAEKAALASLRRAEARWRVLLDHLPDTSVLTIDQDLRYTIALGAGLDRQEMSGVSGLTLFETSSPENIELLEPLFRRALAGEEGVVELTATRTADFHEVTAVPLPAGADGDQALVVARDVSEARRREEQLLVAKERFASLFEEAPFAVMVLGMDGVVADVNPAACALVGRPREELVGEPASVAGGTPLRLAALLRGLEKSPAGRVSAEARLTHRDGHRVDVSFEAIVLRGHEGDARQILINAVDISERRRFEAQLAHLADHDPLTGLANRRRFDHELERHLDLCARYGPHGALLMIDLDNFKEVNDALGHGAGDQLIVSVANLLRSRMRKSDLVARLGGDEFVVLLSEADGNAAGQVAEDVVRLVREQASFLDGSRPRRVTASVGVVLIDQPGVTASELLSTVDLTMYDAKESGRNRYVLLDTEHFETPRSGAHMAWARRIEAALDEDRLLLHAQPIMSLAEDRITGAELLLRLVDETGELVLPGRFLYIAERLGLITGLDTWVAERAISLLEQIRGINPSFRLEVNVSGHSVSDPDFGMHITQRVSAADIDPTQLVFEITETAAVANIETARHFADRLAELGCRFALDDFGAGFGSFYYLKHLPFDFVKIDGEFIEKCPSNVTDRLILSSIVDIAHGLGKQTIAEFVATEEILEVCRELGADHVQGYHVGYPVSLDRVEAWAREGAVNADLA